jgi:hypothetical protein
VVVTVAVEEPALVLVDDRGEDDELAVDVSYSFSLAGQSV